jgi:tetratricopeptide (TPR) repeat protein
MTGAAGWPGRLRGTTAAEGVALVAGIAVFGYVAWDGALWDARLQLLLHLIGIGAILALGALATRGAALPRTRIDVPILGLLGAQALATAAALNVGMSLRATAGMVAMAAMLPVALIAIRRRPTWVALAVGLPVLGLAAAALGAMLARRVEWVLSGAPGLPPIRLPAEGTPFGSVAVPPFILLGAWALAGIVEDAGLRRGLRGALLLVGIPLTLLSGSRSAWLAIGVSVVVLAAPWAWRQRHRVVHVRRFGRREILLGAGIVAAGAAALVLVGPRLTAVTSLIYRGELWRDTLAAWTSDPITGVGPGFMPYARQAAAPDFSFPVSQPHSHNLALGVLGDAGLLGLAAGAALFVTFLVVAGPWRSRTPAGRVASAALVGLAAGGLTEDLTFLPGFDLIVILLVAVALADAGAVTWRPIRPTRGIRDIAALAATAVAGTALLAAMVTNDAAAIAYRSGVDAADDGAWPVAVDAFQRAVAMDPWHPLGPDALAVALAVDGRVGEATLATAAAVERNPGNGRAWTNRAVLCGLVGDAACRLEAADRAAATAVLQSPSLVNAALAYEALGRIAEADEAYRRSLLTNPLTSFGAPWPRVVDPGDGSVDPPGLEAPDLNLLLARWAAGVPIDPDAYALAPVRALAFAMRGDDDAARAELDASRGELPASLLTWDIHLVLLRHWGEPTDDVERIAAALRGSPVDPPDHPIEIPGVRYDIGSFRILPRDGFVPQAEDLRVEPLFPWILETVLPGR